MKITNLSLTIFSTIVNWSTGIFFFVCLQPLSSLSWIDPGVEESHRCRRHRANGKRFQTMGQRFGGFGFGGGQWAVRKKVMTATNN